MKKPQKTPGHANGNPKLLIENGFPSGGHGGFIWKQDSNAGLSINEIIRSWISRGEPRVDHGYVFH